MVIGVFILKMWEERTGAGLLFRPPSFRILLEETGEKEGELTGRILWMEERPDQMVMDLECGRAYGKVKLYGKKELTKNLHIGNVISAEGTFFLYASALNPGGFDVRSYYDALGTYMAFSAKKILVKEKKVHWIKDALFHLNQSLSKAVDETALKEDGGIIKAIFLGNKSELDEELKKDYQLYGIIHILSISGLHIALIGNLMHRILKKFLDSKVLPFLFSGVLMCLFVVFTGASSSSIRALISFLCMTFAPVIKEKYDPVSGMSFSVVLLVLERPLIVFTSGFLYCFSALIGIFIVSQGILQLFFERDTKFQGIVLSLALQCTSLPVMIFQNYTYNLFSAILNVLVLPVVGLLLFSSISGTLCACILRQVGKFLYGTGHFIIKYYNALIELTKQIPKGLLVLGRPAPWRMILYYGILFSMVMLYRILFFLRKRKAENQEVVLTKRHKVFTILLLVGVFFLGIGILRADPLKEGNTSIWHLDVGQGDACMVQGQDLETVLIDGGSSDQEKVYETILRPALFCYGIEHLKGIFVSHFDTDHVSGILELLESGEIQVDRIYVPRIVEEENCKRMLNLAKKNRIPVQVLDRGQKVSLKSGTFFCYWPGEGGETNANDLSQVLLYQSGKFQELLTGDISESVEKDLKISTKVQVLKVAHHGSKYSTSKGFLESVYPKVGILSYGKANRYGHPHPELLNRFLEKNIKTYATGGTGGIHIRVVGKEGFRIEKIT